MALFLFRFSILFTIGLIINSSILAVSSYATQNGTEPKIKFVVEPPPSVIANVSKPVFLSCSAILPDYIKPKHSDTNDDDEEDNDENGENARERAKIISELYKNNPFWNKSNASDSDHLNGDGDNSNDGDAKDDDYYEFGFRHRRDLSMLDNSNTPIIYYTWYRNDEELLSTLNAYDPSKQQQQAINGFRLFLNGTLKIQSNFTAGRYRCLADASHLRLRNVSAILSRESEVIVAVFGRDKTVVTQKTVFEGVPFVLTCPVQSNPPANITWFFNKNRIFFDINYGLNKRNNRYFLLQNGSLLVSYAHMSDSGKFKCNATNIYSNKSLRSSSITVNIKKTNSSDADATQQINDTRLFPRLQNEIQRIKTGDSLILHCIAHNFGTMEWTFTPRHSSIPIKLPNISNELKYVNVLLEKHDGIYNCSSGIDYQLYDVTILQAPAFVQAFSSIMVPMAISTSLNCSVTGNPMPTITWYKNGQSIKDDSVRYYEYPTYRIESIEPEDEGIYQCFAKNEMSEIVTTALLTVRDNGGGKKIPPSPEKLKCYPVNSQTILLKFESRICLQMISYFLASDNPKEWIAPASITVNDTKSKVQTIQIDMNLKPMKMFTVFLRSLVENESKTNLLISRLSEGIQCTTQGLPVYNISLEVGIFLWWSKLEYAEATSFTIQFQHDDSLKLANFTSLIGTNVTLHETVNKNTMPDLVKIPAITIPTANSGDEDNEDDEEQDNYCGNYYNSRRRRNVTATTKPPKEITNITGLRVSGDVTGILIPNASRLVVRIIAATAANGEPMDQDYKFLEWNTIEWSAKPPVAINNFKVVDIESKSVRLSWITSEMDDKNYCVSLCYKNKNEVAFIRATMKYKCQMISIAATTYILRGLSSFTPYNIYLKICDTTNVIADIDVRTKQDVPGPVTKHKISWEKGLTLYWEPPTNPNGVLLYYHIEWKIGDEYHVHNVSVNEKSFEFPNITNEDYLNVTIKAVGSTGTGLPIYLRIVPRATGTEPEPVLNDSLIAIIMALIFVVGLIVFCVIFFLRNRGCKKNRTNINHNQTFAPAPTLDAPCSTDIHEMQTLITQPELPTLIPNGRVKPIQDNGASVAHSESERRRNLTTDIDEHKEVTPITAGNHATVYFTNGKNGKHAVLADSNKPQEVPPKINGYVKTASVVVPIAIPVPVALPQPESQYDPVPNRSSSFNRWPKTNQENTANLRITENPQFSPDNSTISIFDNSQQKLIDLTIDSNNSIPHMDDDDNNNVEDIKIIHKANDNHQHQHHHHPQPQPHPNHPLQNLHHPHQNQNHNHNHNSNHLHNHQNHNRVSEERTADEEAPEIQKIETNNHHHHPHHDSVNVSSEDLNYDLNDSNLSSKPLHTNWDFRRPIVGPNG